MFELIAPFIISLAIGISIGIERERSHPREMQAMGMRTFVLISLLGTTAAFINNNWLTLLISIFVFIAILVSYLKSTTKLGPKVDIGITTEIAATMTYLIGYITLENYFIAIVLGIIVLMILLGRDSLHKFARKKITRKEIHATLATVIIFLLVLSVLPNHTIDPWGLFNPQKFGLIVGLLVAFQLGGYIAIRVFGADLGIILTGFFGGLISSTAIFLTLPKKYGDKQGMLYSTVTACLFSIIATLLEFLLVIFILSPKLFEFMVWPVLAMIIVASSSALLGFKKSFAKTANIFPSKKPVDFVSVIRIAVLISGMLLLVSIGKNYFGDAGVQLISFLAGLFEMQSATFASSILFVKSKLTFNDTLLTLGYIITASYLSKLVILAIYSRNKFGLITASYMFAMFLAGASTFILLLNGTIH